MSNYLISKYPSDMDLTEMLRDTMTSWSRERPDLDLAPMGTFLRLAALMNVAIRTIDETFTPHGITIGEFDVLAALRRGGDGNTMTPTALARVAMVSPGGMTNRLDRLAAARLVERRPDPADRRGSLVELTAAGRETADRAVEDLVAAEAVLLRGLGETERARFDRLLDKVVGGLSRPAQPAPDR